jgi:glycosyltransferase A (GT-A) superfamily protein (DUF2064 family)
MAMMAQNRRTPDRACLVVCLKAPERSKRRLAAELGDTATIAAHHLLACALEDARAWHGPVVLAPADSADANWIEHQPELDYDVVVQTGDSLGARINDVDRTLRARGFERLIFIGTDCPALDDSYLREADAALAASDAVLGPATDGGVVLMAARRPWPDIGSLAWSTPALFDGLIERLTAEAWSLAALDTLADIDAPADLAAIEATLASDSRPARRALATWLAARDRSQESMR